MNFSKTVFILNYNLKGSPLLIHRIFPNLLTLKFSGYLSVKVRFKICFRIAFFLILTAVVNVFYDVCFY